jgi:hypothetical protein
VIGIAGGSLLNTEERAEHPSLSAPVVLGNPEHLAFSDHLRCFNAFDCRSGGCESPRSLHGSPAALHMPVI